MASNQGIVSRCGRPPIAPAVNLAFLPTPAGCLPCCVDTGAALLASTPRTPVEAFRFGSALGTQFHPEADAALLESWLATGSMVAGLTAEEVARIRADGRAHLPGLHGPALASFGVFAAAVRQRRGG